MEYGFWDFAQLIGSLGIFIYGMKLMSEGLQKAAGNKMREILAAMTKSRMSGIITGMLTTIGVQSSSATTVMVVSFVNAGLLTLGASLGVIMGANIGTTVTAWLVAILGFKVKITPIAIMLIGFSFWFLFSRKSRIRSIAEFVVGFGILFIGLSFLKDSVPNLKENPDMLQFISSFTDLGYLSIFIFIIIGTLLTVIVQSSSAATAVTLTILSQGWIPFELACAMVLGENIGTTVTANIAAAIGNVHAKRAALFHLIFNVIGVMWMLIFFYPFTRIVHDSIPVVYDFLTRTFGEGNYSKTSVLKDADLMGMALFHTTFNVLNVVLLFALVPAFEKLVIRLIKPKGEDDEEFTLQYISAGIMNTPELSITNAKKEVQVCSKIVTKMGGNVKELLFGNPKNHDKLAKKVRKRETITDDMQIAITGYLAQVAQTELSASTSQQVQGLLRATNELESIADVFYSMVIMEERFRDENYVSPEDLKTQIEHYFELIQEQLDSTNANLLMESEKIKMKTIYDNEHEIDMKRNQLVTDIYSKIENNVFPSKQGVFYLDLVKSIERIGDMLVNVNQAASEKETES